MSTGPSGAAAAGVVEFGQPGEGDGMRQTWRWFGPIDRARIDDAVQAGAEGIVSALHHIPPGRAWPPQEIARRQAEIARMADGRSSGLAWEVVESIPVSEDIKRQAGDWRAHVAAWADTLRHLHGAGLRVVCYNFMPVLDWTRTETRWPLPTGATAMRFDLIDFAAFDLHLLGRPAAARDYPAEVAEAADRRFARMDEAARARLAREVAMGLPGEAEPLSPAGLRDRLDAYGAIPPERLRRNLIDFLSEVAPVAEALGMRLGCHPDDPPFPLLGLPRVMSTEADCRAVLDAVDLPANGVTLCTGSLGARGDNDLPGMMRRLGPRVHFLHLRNVRREGTGTPLSFHESEHLGGDVDMVAVLRAVRDEEARRRAEGRADWSIPMRPDHGQDIIDDAARGAMPGYPVVGRLRGLAELRGVWAALTHAGAA